MQPKNFKESLYCIEKACYQAGLSFEYLFDSDFIAQATYPNQENLIFLHNKNPFNSYISSRICQDKDLQHKFYTKDNIPHPKTKSYFNPKSPAEFLEYSSFQSVQSIKEDILKNFQFPFLFKKNRSSLSKDVFLVQTPAKLQALLDKYFQPQKYELILIQEYIPGTEYRIISWKGEPLLAYTKKNKFSPNSSKSPQKVEPLQFKEICQKIYSSLQVNFCGIDLMVKADQSQIILETNANPACFYYNKHHGRQDFTQVYLKCLQEYQS
jgi:glutathione synthase/RimK-type ligase-like ATP-grasp enzyme